MMTKSNIQYAEYEYDGNCESTNMFIWMIRRSLGENSRETLFGGL